VILTVDYYLIAIHTSLEDYRLASINQLPINLSKSRWSSDFYKEGETKFAGFIIMITKKFPEFDSK
jgi:hypothetical protein